MPNKTSAPTPRVHWNHEETAALVRFLHDNRHEAGDNGNFKMATYQAAALHIANYCTDGPPKNYQAVRNKWTGYIRKIYRDIEYYRAQPSGAHWDNEKGANIQGQHAEQVFEDFVKSHPLIRQFKTSGWDLYPYVADIIPHGGAHGAN
ncbi:hypothetical protein M404DRAFT_167969, partial [Pisolithus tinctorius Marx 270]